MLEVTNLTKLFAPGAGIEGVSLRFEDGAVYAIIGPNGAGKSTLLDVISGLTRPDAGTIRLDARRIERMTPRRFRLMGGIRMFQKPRVFTEMTVREYLRLSAPDAVLRTIRNALAAKGPDRDDLAPYELLRDFGLSGKLDELYLQLSGGERRIVELATALASIGSIYVLDEPSAGLSQQVRDTVIRQLQIMREARCTIIFAEHDAAFVKAVATKIVTLRSGHVESAVDTEQSDSGRLA